MSHPRGVRQRLLLVVILSVAASLALMTVAFNLLLWRSLSADATRVVRSRAMAEASSVDTVGDKVTAPEAPDTAGLEGQAWVFVNGRAIEKPRVSPALDAAAAGVATTPGVTVDVPGQQARLYAVLAEPDGTTVATVVAGVSMTPYQRTQRLALIGSIALSAATVVVVALIARWMLTAALRPVARMTADVALWSESEPERRFAVGEPYDELSRLAATLDGLLDRQAAGLRREQRFSAELSHELRTPLASIAAEAELALRREREPVAYQEALQAVQRSAQQMSRTIETLVAAAQQQSAGEHGRADARAVLEEVADLCASLADDHGVFVDVAPTARTLNVGIDADIAVRILQPIVENACRFAAARVTLAARRGGSEVILSVVDDGPGVPPERVETIFEPGVSGDEKEDVTAKHHGAGLGLALSRRLARAADGDVEAISDPAGGRFRVRLPAG